jgi:hypothetical protein
MHSYSSISAGEVASRIQGSSLEKAEQIKPKIQWRPLFADLRISSLISALQIASEFQQEFEP